MVNDSAAPAIARVFYTPTICEDNQNRDRITFRFSEKVQVRAGGVLVTEALTTDLAESLFAAYGPDGTALLNPVNGTPALSAGNLSAIDFTAPDDLSELDQGLYGGLLGGDVRFLAHPENGWISSMVPPAAVIFSLAAALNL